MDAITFQGVRQVAFQRVPRPRLEQPGDAVVRIQLAGLCGSDLHPYEGREQGIDVGTVMGHEFVGTVVEAGSAVTKFQPGDRVMSPFTTCCGSCFYCARGLTCRCEAGQLFGWVEGGRGLHGAQAQYIRVPLADATLAHVPEGVSNEEALLLGDILSTAFFCAINADIPALAAAAASAAAPAPAAAGGAGASVPGGASGGEVVVAVVGCGPVGLLAVAAARELGATRVLAVDSVPERLALAQQLGAEPVNREQRDPLLAVREATEGRGADAVLELVGAPAALGLAYQLLRPGGVLSSVGCHSEPSFPFTPVDAYNKNLTLRSGRCPARHLMDRVLPVVQCHRHEVTAVISHRLALREGVQAYERFAARQCLKVVLDPWHNRRPPATQP